MDKTLTHSQRTRSASYAGDLLVVSTLSSGVKVLVDFCDRDQIVELQAYRRVRLIGVPELIQKAFGVTDYTQAIHVTLPFLGNASAFSFNGSCNHAVCLYCLPDGVIVDVLSDPACAGVRAPVMRPQPVLQAHAAVLVAAA